MEYTAILKPNLPKFLISVQDPQFSNIIFKINELNLLSAKFPSIGNIFHFWNHIFLEWGIDTCFNVECVLLDCNYDFFGGYFVVTGCYLVVAAHYLVLLLDTAHYRLLLFVPTFSMNGSVLVLSIHSKGIKFQCFLI